MRQGDPLSPILLNAVMDLVLAHLDRQLGCDLGSTRLNHLTFADDVALLSQTQASMVRLAAEFETALASVGLRVNVDKSATLSIVADGHRKRWLCDKTPFVEFGGRLVGGMDVGQYHKYLGTTSGAIPAQPTSVKTALELGLRKLSKAPLKPQQRLALLNDHLLPNLTHRLVIDERLPSGLLRDVDKHVRRNVRRWLHLPKDTTNEFIHASVKDGGLGVYQHVVQARLARRDRIEGLITRSLTTNDPALQRMVNNSTELQEERCRLSAIESSGILVNDKEGHKAAVAAGLYRTVDGKGLQSHQQTPILSRWVRGRCADDRAQLCGSHRRLGSHLLHCRQGNAWHWRRPKMRLLRSLGVTRARYAGLFENLGHANREAQSSRGIAEGYDGEARFHRV